MINSAQSKRTFRTASTDALEPRLRMVETTNGEPMPAMKVQELSLLGSIDSR